MTTLKTKMQAKFTVKLKLTRLVQLFSPFILPLLFTTLPSCGSICHLSCRNGRP